ncbi:hypothetical protein B0H10DRAFT_1951359 [Mycena sp. CBHHK59/15]|nr:hypothetical protein B0H10DRAFT_1951359 [Mycena sp. CBHHK59/15]
MGQAEPPARLFTIAKECHQTTAITLSPVKACPQKKHRGEDPDDSDNHVVLDLMADLSKVDRLYTGAGSTPEPPTAAPTAFKMFGKFTTQCTSPHCDSDDLVSIHTFPTPCAPSISDESDDNNDLENENLPPELDELCAPEAGAFAGDGYPCPAPPKSFLEKMAAIGTKQILAVAPDITAAKAALLDIELVL